MWTPALDCSSCVDIASRGGVGAGGQHLVGSHPHHRSFARGYRAANCPHARIRWGVLIRPFTSVYGPNCGANRPAEEPECSIQVSRRHLESAESATMSTNETARIALKLTVHTPPGACIAVFRSQSRTVRRSCARSPFTKIPNLALSATITPSTPFARVRVQQGTIENVCTSQCSQAQRGRVRVRGGMFDLSIS